MTTTNIFSVSNTTELSPKVTKILCHLYDKVESLEEFAEAIIAWQSAVADPLVRPEDSASYVSFLKSTVVCTPYNARPLAESWLLQQHSHQDEVILRVIERIRQREGRSSMNLLLIGYRLMSDDRRAQVSSSLTVEYSFPNSNTSRLQYTPWKVLLSRIGDDAMEFLLETRVIFVPAVSTCYVQVTGTPMYELWPFHRYYSQNQRNPTTKKFCTSLLNDSKFRSRKRCRRKSQLSNKMHNNLLQPYESNESVHKSCAVVVHQETREKQINSERVGILIEDKSGGANTVPRSTATESKVIRLGGKRKHKDGVDSEPNKKRKVISNFASVSYTEQVVENSRSHVDADVEPSQAASSTSFSGTSSSLLCTTAHYRNHRRRRKRKGKLSDGNVKERRQKSVAFDHRLSIERTPMFFSRDLTEKYPPRYVLLNSDALSSSTLVADVLSVRVLYDNASSESSVAGAETSECCREVKQRLCNMMQLIARNHRLCRYRYLLQHHCSYSLYTAALSEKQTRQKHSGSLTVKPTPVLQVPVYCRGSKSSSSDLPVVPVPVLQERAQLSNKKSKQFSIRKQLSIRNLLEQYCSRRSVYLFVRACCLRVIPTQLFGSSVNRNQFFRNVQNVIVMGRYEKLSLGCLMRCMRVTHCHWMKEIRSNTERLQMLAKLLCWLLNAFVLPLIKSYFYVTDSATYRNRMFYYRKSLWKKIHQKGLAVYVDQGFLQKISSQEADEKVRKGLALGFASLRFMPKSSSLRPIINLSQRTKVAGAKAQESSINWQLQDVQNVLTYERQRNPDIIGASVFSLDDIYVAWKRFVETRQSRRDDRPLYFVKVDIENCYDSIDRQKLYDILLSVLSGEYIVRRYVSVVEAGGRLRRTYHRDATSFTDFQPSFVRFVKDRAEERGTHNAFFIDQVLHAHEDGESLLRKLRSHLFCNIVKVGRQHFVQTHGIAQGSAVSTLLCNIYYGKMEASYVSIAADSELLMRQVDDFLYVTPSYQNAVAFLAVMLREIPEYNCRVNRHKTLVNFELGDSEIGADDVPRLTAGALFPWCGLLIDTSTLAVVADYTRYAGISMSDTITIDLARNAGRAMRNKLMFSLRARCHRIFFDGDVNPAAVQNVYRVFLLAAFKLHAFSTHLHNGPQRNPAFFVDVIFETAGFVNSFVAGSVGIDSSARQWLCLEAFRRKLGRHAGVYGAVLSVLVGRQRELQRRIDESHLAELRRIVGDDLPCDFQYILP